MSAQLCMCQTNQLDQVQPLKYHRYDIETGRYYYSYSSAIDLHNHAGSLHRNSHLNFCQAGSQVGIKTYDKQ